MWEGDEPNDIRRLTYEEVLRKVCQIANALLRSGVKKGDIVTVYMPMIPELAMTVSAVKEEVFLFLFVVVVEYFFLTILLT